jgi:hypothetical protein
VRGRRTHRDRDYGAHARTLTCVLALAACHHELADVDGIFDDGSGQKVHCAVDLDDDADNSTASIDGALDRAADRKETVELYAHHPGVTVSTGTIEHVLEGAVARGLTFVQYRDFAAGTASGPGLALSFDDTSIDAWIATQPLFAQYDAKVTFFVSRFKFITDAQRAELHALADAGHDIEAHSVLHLRAPEYVEDNGIAAYLDDEAQPSIDVLEAEGFDVVAFAYPFGSRTDELDRALLDRVTVLRSVAFPWSVGVDSPCPR